ncbi:MAG: hypothetical protein ACI8QZ_000174 [Chlamydiales bacterium]
MWPLGIVESSFAFAWNGNDCGVIPAVVRRQVGVENAGKLVRVIRRVRTVGFAMALRRALDVSVRMDRIVTVRTRGLVSKAGPALSG